MLIAQNYVLEQLWEEENKEEGAVSTNALWTQFMVWFIPFWLPVT